MTEVISVRFRGGAKTYYFDPNGLTIHPDQYVVVETSQGLEYVCCVEGNHEVSDQSVVQPLRPVIRIATENDHKAAAYNRKREKEAFSVCEKKLTAHTLEMKLVNVECNFEGNKIIFFFTAEGRVDFRELVKDLAGVFRARIELRQIGVRDEAKMLGGLGICGRPLCCSQFLEDFIPVSIKMAKTQNLSLNPTKISGTCGRLMCCLKYEQEAYEDLLRTSPKLESFVDTPEGRGTVVEIDLLRQRVKVRMEDSPETISVFANGDIAVLRNGKAKKNDPPIPADLAPISGSGKRVRKQEENEKILLEPIRFRYSTESVVEEPEVTAEPVRKEEEAPQKSSRSSRRKNRGNPEGQKTEAQKQEQPKEKKEPQPKEKKEPQPKADQPKEKKEPRPPREKKEPRQESKPREKDAAAAEAPSAEKSGDQPKKNHHRRPNYRRHRKPKPQGEN